MRFLTVGLLLVSSAALGQTTLTLTVNNATNSTEVIGLNREDCGSSLPVTWTAQGNPCESMSIWVTTASSCAKAPAAGDLVLDPVPRENIVNRGTMTRSIAVNSLPLFTGTDAGTCGANEEDKVLRVCGFFKSSDLVGNCSTEVVSGTPPQLRFDTKRPPKPNLIDVVARDSALGVTLEAEDDSTVKVTARRVNADGTLGDEVSSDETTADDGTATLEGLENGVTYSVTAAATDQAENTSEASDPKQGTPIKSSGFYDDYVTAGGKETGGCGAAGGGLAGGALLAALGFWLSRRKQS